MKQVYDFLGGRKILFALILFATASVFLAFGKVEAAQWFDFSKWIFGLYVGGNAGEHIANAIKK